MINYELNTEIAAEIEAHKKRFIRLGREYTKGYLESVEERISPRQNALACFLALTRSASEVSKKYPKYWGAMLALKHLPAESLRRAI